MPKMVITELYIKNFGKFSDRHISLHDGLQVITGENEYGKSTIHAFIRAMLFGLERGRGRAAAKDDYTRYEPWGEPGYYAGTMRFLCGGRTFRLERSFGRYSRQASLICEDDGEELSVEQGDLSVLLGGLTPGLFDSTVSIGQLKSEPGQELSAALENYAANYYETGDGEIDLNAAFQVLREKRREAEKAVREEEAEAEAARRKLLQECAYLERDMQRLQSDYEKCRARLHERNRERTIERNTERAAERQAGRGGAGSGGAAGTKGTETGGKSLMKLGAAGLLAGLLGIAWGLLLGNPWFQENVKGLSGMSSFPFLLIGGCVAAVGIAALMAGGMKKVRGRSTAGQKVEQKPRQELNTQNTEEKKRLAWEMDRIRGEWKEKEIRRENLREQCEESESSETLAALKRRCTAIALAEEELKKAAEETGSQTMRMMNAKASEIFAFITEGKYKRIDLDENRKISVWDGERRTAAERLSRGTIEQIYFAVRMAAADLLLEEPVPVILDDVFAFYDDKRLVSALKWLSSCGKQVIIFSCHKREEEIVKKEELL